MELGFTGTRETLAQAQADALCKALWYYRQWCEIMHNGDCVGADEYAGRYWLRCGGQLWSHPPAVKRHRAFLPSAVESKALPYLRRNMQIVLASDVVIATPKESHEQLRSGTWTTIRYAKDAGKQLFIIFPDGTTHEFKPQWE